MMDAIHEKQLSIQDGFLAPRPQGFFRRLREKDNRRRVMHTSFVMFAFFTMGWMVGMDGTTFPDIRQFIVHKDLATASWIQTAGGLGYLVGTIVGGLSFDKFNRLGILTSAAAGMALTKAVTPYCTNFALMLVVSIVNSIAMGGLDTCGNARVSSLWGEQAGPFMHAVHFGFSFGAILGPLAANPFLAPKRCAQVDPTSTTTSATIATEYGYQSTNDGATSVYVLSDVTTPSWNLTGNTTTSDCVDEYGESNVQYSFLIAAAFSLAAALPFLVTLVIKKDATPYEDVTKGENQKTGDTSVSAEGNVSNLPVLSTKQKVLFAILLAALLGVYCGVEYRFSELLMTFIIEKLDWAKTTGSLMTSIFWATFSLGRLFGVFVARVFKPATMILVYSVALVVCFVGFLLAVQYEIDALVWVTTSLAGLSMSIIFPSIFTWTAESFMVVTGKVSGVYLACVSGVNMAVPLLYGNLMQHLDQLWFVYLLIGQSILFCVLFFVIVTLKRTLIIHK